MTTLLIVSSSGRPRRDDEPLLGQGYPVAGEGEPASGSFSPSRVARGRANGTRAFPFLFLPGLLAISRTWWKKKNLDCARKKKNRKDLATGVSPMMRRCWAETAGRGRVRRGELSNEAIEWFRSNLFRSRPRWGAATRAWVRNPCTSLRLKKRRIVFGSEEPSQSSSRVYREWSS